MTRDIRETFAHGVNDVAGESDIRDGVDSRVDGATWLEAQRDRRIGDRVGKGLEKAVAVAVGRRFGSCQFSHADDDPSLQLGESSNLGLDIRRNTGGRDVES